MEDEKKDLITDIHIHSHRAFVQLSRMERMPMTDGERELWIVELKDKFEVDEDTALDFLYSHLNDLHCEGRFKESDYILCHFLQEGDFLEKHFVCGLGLLSISYPARKELTRRALFFDFFQEISCRVKGEWETEAILTGLKD